MNKPSLPKFLNVWHRLPEYLKTLQLNVQALDINKTIVGEIVNNNNDLNQGDSFIIGKKYIVTDLQVGDDFSNIGFASVGVVFTATGTTPSIWSNNSSVLLFDMEIIQYYNDLDPLVYINYAGGSNFEIKITNNGFTTLKTFPNIVGGSNINIIDSNTITYNAQNTPKYFKIEVYN